MSRSTTSVSWAWCRLTDLGLEAASRIDHLLGWIEDRVPAILDRQRAFDARTP